MINDDSDIALGVDIGGTNTKIGIVNRDGIIQLQSCIPTITSGMSSEFLKNLRKEVDDLLANFGDRSLSGIGVGAPSANSQTGIVENAVNLSWEKKVNFRKFFQEYYHVPVFVNNDANVAAIGEKIYGAAQGMQDFITITLGTGVGCGIFSNGELIQGPDNLAGEIGHITSMRDGRLCSCGRRGCLETYVSTVGIRRTVYKLISDFNLTNSPLTKVLFEDMTSEMIYEQAMEKDPLAIQAFEFTGRILGLQLADLVAFSNPRAIFLVGGLANAGDLLITPAKNALDSHLLKNYQNTVNILPSALPYNSGAILGASAQVWESVDHLVKGQVGTGEINLS